MAESIYHIYRNNKTDREKLEDEFNKPMPWIGIYIAVASLVCTLAMGADMLRNFKHKRLWFPCKYFALNAASVTVIGVAMKLPVDLNNPMYGRWDQQAKVLSLVFLCTMLANFMPSLGAMGDEELLMNIIALVILVITIFVNICIEISTNLIASDFGVFFVIVVCGMLLMLTIIICSALTVSVYKKVIHLKYREMHKSILASTKDSEHMGIYNIENLKEEVVKYWIMAVTSSPQFGLSCSEACSACAAICLTLDVLLMVSTQSMFTYSYISKFDSVYKDSILKILIIQWIGVVVGSIAPVSRLFTALSFKLSIEWSKNYLKVFKIDGYWTQRLEEWKRFNPLENLPVGGRKFRKFIHLVKNLFLELSVKLVTVIVVLSKIIRLLANFLVIFLFYCYFIFKYLKSKCLNGCSAPSTPNAEETCASQSESMHQYVLQLHEDVELSRRTLKNIINTINHFLLAARKRQPKDLIDLLEKSKDFDGVVHFDSDQVPQLCSGRLPNCWSLTVITLTSIAIALPGIENNAADRLLNSVKEGLSYVKQIEKTLDAKGDLVTVMKASNLVWPGVELCGVWLKINLKKKPPGSKVSTLQWLCDNAKTIVMEERTLNGDPENADDWSVEAIAANSMYRICQTIMLGYQGCEHEADDRLFEQLSKTIADILCACLTNLPRVISMKCYSSAIEKREESVRTAACLLGEAEEILKALSQRELPSLDLNQMAYLEEWRQSIRLQK